MIALGFSGWTPMIIAMVVITVLRILSKKIKPLNQLRFSRQ
jgi:hypothetical protein